MARPSTGFDGFGCDPAAAENLIQDGYFVDSILDGEGFYLATLMRRRDSAAAVGSQSDPVILGDNDGGDFGFSYSDDGIRFYWYEGTEMTLAVDGVEASPITVGHTWYDTYETGLGFGIGRGFAAYGNILVHAVYAAQPPFEADAREAIRNWVTEL